MRISSLATSFIIHGAVVGAALLTWRGVREPDVAVTFQFASASIPEALVPPAEEPVEAPAGKPTEEPIEIRDPVPDYVLFEESAPRMGVPPSSPLRIPNVRLKKPLPRKTTTQPPSAPAPASAAVEAPPVATSCPPPSYPALARRMGHQGTVKLRLRIDTRGAVIEAAIEKSSGSKILDGAALRAARSWTFQPATKDGSVIAGEILQPVEFRLQ